MNIFSFKKIITYFDNKKLFICKENRIEQLEKELMDNLDRKKIRYFSGKLEENF